MPQDKIILYCLFQYLSCSTTDAIMDTLTRDFDQGLLCELECPVCLEYMLPPIVFCQNGHNICSICKPKLKECPTCRQQFVNIRNIALENIARRVEYPCTNRKFGCKESFPLDFINDHQTICQYAPYTCPFMKEHACDWTGVFHDLKTHLLKFHNQDVREQEGATSLIINTDSVELKGCKVMFAHNEIFYIHIQRECNNYYIAVRYVGTTENASKYGYKISFHKQNSIECITVCHVPRTVSEELDDIFEAGDCFKLPCDLLKRYVTCEANLPYKLEIFKV